MNKTSYRLEKLRGFNVDLNDVEKAFSKYSKIHAVIARVTAKGPYQQIILFAFTDDNCCISEERLKAFARKTLPCYLVPCKIIFIYESNQFARPFKFSPSLTRSRGGTDMYSNQDRNAFTDLVCRTLDIDCFTMEDNFIDLGGNSFLAIMLVCQLKKRYQAKVSVADLLENDLKTVFDKIQQSMLDLPQVA